MFVKHRVSTVNGEFVLLIGDGTIPPQIGILGALNLRFKICLHICNQLDMTQLCLVF